VRLCVNKISFVPNKLHEKIRRCCGTESTLLDISYGALNHCLLAKFYDNLFDHADLIRNIYLDGPYAGGFLSGVLAYTIFFTNRFSEGIHVVFLLVKLNSDCSTP
jgi:hypothetical protein